QRSQLSKQLNEFFMDYGAGYGFYFSTIRRPASGYPEETHFPDPLTEGIDENRRQRHNQAGQRYRSEKYLSFIWNPENRAEVSDFKDHLAELEDKLESILVPKRLEGRQHLELLYYNMHGIDQSIYPPDRGAPIDRLLANDEIQVLPIYDRQNHWLRSSLNVPMQYMVKDGPRFIQTLSITGFPNETYNGVIHSLNRLTCDYRWTTRVSSLYREDQEEKLKEARNSWRIRRKGFWDMLTGATGGQETQDEDVSKAYKNLSAISKMQDTSIALAEIADRKTSFAIVTSTITLISEDMDELNKHTATVMDCVRDNGFTANIERFNSLDSWLGSIPGHSRNIRRTKLSTLNISDIIPTWSMWTGREKNPSKFMSGSGPHWQAKTIANEPFKKHRPASGDVGHSMIIGATGGGKSTYANFEIAQWLRHRNSQVFLFDKGYSGQLLCEAVGGDHYDLFSRSSTSFQPLRGLTPETLTTSGYYSDWIEDLFTLQNVKLSSRDKNKIRKALRKVSKEPQQARTLSQFSFHLQDRRLKDTIRVYTRDGDYGNILDGSGAEITDSRYQVFELNRLLDNAEKIVLPVLMHLFHKVETSLDRTRPTLIIIEEAWSAFSNKHFQSRLKNWLATLRKHNGHVCLVAHSPEQITRLPQASMFVANTPERVFLPNANIEQPKVKEHYDMFGLTDVQMNTIKNLIPKKQYYIQTP